MDPTGNPSELTHRRGGLSETFPPRELIITAKLYSLLLGIGAFGWGAFIVYVSVKSVDWPSGVVWYSNNGSLAKLYIFNSYGLAATTGGCISIVTVLLRWPRRWGTVAVALVLVAIGAFQYLRTPYEPSHVLGHDLFNECSSTIYTYTRHVAICICVAGASLVLGNWQRLARKSQPSRE